jgi:hypothetical protein
MRHRNSRVEVLTPSRELSSQLELFATPPRVVAFTEVGRVGALVARELEGGKTVGIVRSERGLELLVSQGDHLRLGARCGFSRRPVELLLRAVVEEGRRLWARPAGGPWVGWAEWGNLPMPREVA